ncbi:MAG TPA: outer membrane protein assembly factor BamD [Steroidobacteraceae bacterium]|jgi:outer membrane protein assembly factor BamD|nr:outer membrane protein assembly factor BamD [Steroidobacteraceae bacterium]
MSVSAPARAGVLALCVVLAALCGCHRSTRPQAPRETPETLYKRAHKEMNNYNWNGAIKDFEKLTATFPFTDETRQARLDLIYVYYRANEKESAIDAAETFIRENPTHPRVDYAWYIKGLVNFEKTPNAIEGLFRADMTKRPPSDAKKSFAAFKVVVEQYPKSAYAPDSMQRMIYLRNRLASYEVHVARFYLKRRAYVASAQRARNAIQEYDGAPAGKEALQILIASYDHLDLPQLAQQSREVYAYNYQSDVRVAQADENKSWWKFW